MTSNNAGWRDDRPRASCIDSPYSSQDLEHVRTLQAQLRVQAVVLETPLGLCGWAWLKARDEGTVIRGFNKFVPGWLVLAVVVALVTGESLVEIVLVGAACCLIGFAGWAFFNWLNSVQKRRRRMRSGPSLGSSEISPKLAVTAAAVILATLAATSIMNGMNTGMVFGAIATTLAFAGVLYGAYAVALKLKKVIGGSVRRRV